MELWISAIMEWFTLYLCCCFFLFVSHPEFFSRCTVLFVHDRDLHGEWFFVLFAIEPFFSYTKILSVCKQNDVVFFDLEFSMYRTVFVYVTGGFWLSNRFWIYFSFTGALLIPRHTESCLCAMYDFFWSSLVANRKNATNLIQCKHFFYRN